MLREHGAARSQQQEDYDVLQPCRRRRLGVADWLQQQQWRTSEAKGLLAPASHGCSLAPAASCSQGREVVTGAKLHRAWQEVGGGGTLFQGVGMPACGGWACGWVGMVHQGASVRLNT